MRTCLWRRPFQLESASNLQRLINQSEKAEQRIDNERKAPQQRDDHSAAVRESFRKLADIHKESRRAIDDFAR